MAKSSTSRDELRAINPELADRLDSYDQTMRLAVAGILLGAVGAGCGLVSIVVLWMYG